MNIIQTGVSYNRPNLFKARLRLSVITGYNLTASSRNVHPKIHSII